MFARIIAHARQSWNLWVLQHGWIETEDVTRKFGLDPDTGSIDVMIETDSGFQDFYTILRGEWVGTRHMAELAGIAERLLAERDHYAEQTSDHREMERVMRSLPNMLGDGTGDRVIWGAW